MLGVSIIFDMHITIEDFKTGWFGLQVGITDAEIPVLIERLQWLQSSRSHFHAGPDDSGSGNVANVEIFWSDQDSPQGLRIE